MISASYYGEGIVVPRLRYHTKQLQQCNAAEMCAVVVSWYWGVCAVKGPCHGLCIGG